MSEKVSIPLLNDHHSHPLFYSAFRNAIDFSDVIEKEHAFDLIRDRAAVSNQLVLGRSWKDNFFQFEPSELESLPPCAIFNISLHNLAINRSAMEMLSGRIGSDITKLYDREWYERNLQSVLNWFALLNGSAQGLREFFDSLESIGVWSTEEMLLVDPVEIDWFDEAGLAERTKFWADPRTFKTMDERHKKQVAGIKLFTDGAFGARSAANSQAYIGQPENFGMLIYSDDELARVAMEHASDELSLAVHAIGDRAIEQTITMFEKHDVSNRYHLIRIEHAQAITLDQAQRASDLGIILSMQPNFNIDSINYSDRLPAIYVEGNNPFRMLIDDVGFEPGVDLILGSDGMPHGADNAIEQSLSPANELQKLTLAEFIAGYCGVSDKMFEVSLPS